MWKLIVASFLLLIGIVEIILALNGRLREAVMQNSLVRSKSAEPLVLFLVGLSAVAMALGIIVYGYYW
jgi:hypothetical protein